MSRCSIAIIGGGFTGAVVALNLLRALKNTAATIAVIEPRAQLGAGLAYSTTDPAHRVNVPAIRLLVAHDEPGAFHNWLESSGALGEDPAAEMPDGRRYPRRGVFGQYVTQRLAREITAPGAPAFTHIQARVQHAEAEAGGFALTLDDGTVLRAEQLVLAVSHPPPALLPVLRPLRGEEKFIENPWQKDIRRIIAPGDRVLIIGTALSTADCIAALDDAGHGGEILAISRRGLVSRERRLTQGGPYGDFSTNPSRTALALLQAVRRAIREAPEFFCCWESVIEAARDQGPAIWAALPERERKRFLRHLRPFWDVHRYQLAPPLGAVIARQSRAGALEILAARITGADVREGRFRITLSRRGAARVELFDAVINCTGPDHTRVIETNPALRSLAAAGLLRADVFRLGVDTDINGRPLDEAGQPAQNLFIAGPLARAACGELMGIPQVTDHAALVARLAAASLKLAPQIP
jgi:uncharacterized NAD(P)/FAD-binding protein YdhS